MKMKRIMGFFLALVMFMGYLPLNPIASYANGDVKIDDKNFPDENFRNYVSHFFDKDKDGKLSQDELDEVKEISIDDRLYFSSKGQSDPSLKGIEYFKKLTTLKCSNYKLTELDLSKNPNLTYLDCGSNNLTSLDISKNPNLTYLNCSSDNLTSLDVTNNKDLRTLDCFGNNLTSLNVSKNINLSVLTCANNDLTSLDVRENPNLTKLNCLGNYLTSLDVSKNPNLTYLGCFGNYLTSLDVSKNPNLTEFWCNNNKLTELDVSKNPNLTDLSCFTNKLKSLDVSKNPNLTKLLCYENELESLVLGKNPNLTDLDCHKNELPSLDVRENPNLTYLDCNENNLTSLDVSKNTKLTSLNCNENNLTSLDASKNTKLIYLECSKNNLTSLDVSKNTKLIYLDCSNQQYNITVIKGIREFEYGKFPGEFNKDKVTSPDGASFGADALTVDSDNTNKVTYNYKVNDNREMDVTLNVTYFDPENVESMVVKKQPKLSYTEGDKLDLTELVVRLTDKQGLTKDVAFKDFETYKITANPENGAELTLNDNNKPVTLTKINLTAETNTVAANNEKAVKLTKGLLPGQTNTLTAQTNTLTVKEKPTPTPTPTPQDPAVVGPVDPTDPNGGKPADTSKYWTVTFKADPAKGIMGTKNTVYVLKTANKTLADITAPKVTAKPGFKFTGWEPALDANTTINKDMTVNAKFEKVTPTPTDPPVEPKDPPVVRPVDPTQPGGKSQVANNKALPKTANSMNIELYTIFMILSGALLALAFKRKKESQ